MHRLCQSAQFSVFIFYVNVFKVSLCLDVTPDLNLVAWRCRVSEIDDLQAQETRQGLVNHLFLTQHRRVLVYELGIFVHGQSPPFALCTASVNVMLGPH